MLLYMKIELFSEQPIGKCLILSYCKVDAMVSLLKCWTVTLKLASSNLITLTFRLILLESYELPYSSGPVSWCVCVCVCVQNTPTASLQRGKTPDYDPKQSDGEAPVILWGMRSTSSLPLLPGPL